MNEAGLAEANGLVARFYRVPRVPYATLFAIQCRLLKLGVKLDKPVDAPDPHAPPGGSTQALKAVG